MRADESMRSSCCRYLSLSGGRWPPRPINVNAQATTSGRVRPSIPGMSAREAAAAASGARTASGAACMAGRVGLEPLQIHPQRRAFGAGAGQAIDDPRAAFQLDPDPLPLRNRPVHRVGVGEFVGGGDRELSARAARAGSRGRGAARRSAGRRHPSARPRNHGGRRNSGRSAASDRPGSRRPARARTASTLSQNSTAHTPSFSRM